MRFDSSIMFIYYQLLQIVFRNLESTKVFYWNHKQGHSGLPNVLHQMLMEWYPVKDVNCNQDSKVCDK